MESDFRGGNSRLLARALDQNAQPVAILDAEGNIVFVNGALCRLVELDATLLVGKQCSWQISEDRTPAAVLLNTLAPPAGARAGKVSARQFTTPPFFGTDFDAELFVPLVGSDGQVELTLVLLGQWRNLEQQLPAGPARNDARRDAESTLAQLRSRWIRLDGLHALLGNSPASELAMLRAQLSAGSECNTLLYGPSQVGKATVAYGIFCARLKRHGIQAIAGVHFPIDGGVC